jgi:predicted amidohydrolase YtcJ
VQEGIRHKPQGKIAIASRCAQPAGFVITLHGNHPATPLNPMQTMATAIIRTIRNGTVIAGDQSISANQAMQFGPIQVRKMADFTILDGNPLTTDQTELAELQVGGSTGRASIFAGLPP